MTSVLAALGVVFAAFAVRLTVPIVDRRECLNMRTGVAWGLVLTRRDHSLCERFHSSGSPA